MRLRSLSSCLAGLCLLLFLPRPAAAQSCTTSDDAAYTAQIKKDTTLPEFTTDLTDHLPLSSCVDAPDKYLGHIIGAPDVLDKMDKIDGYMRHLESQSKRVKVFDIGKSEEGRETIIVAVSDEATIANLDHYRDITAKLADPRGLSDSAADALIAQGKPMYWAAGSIHSTETGSPEMLMELAYRLAVEDSPFIKNIREHEIVLITPATQVDGRDRDVELYMNHKLHPNEATPGLVWWGHYVDHDDNRDGLTLSLDLSRNVMNAFLQWHPTVLHDLHESEPYLYIQTGTGPYNPWLDPLEINEWQRMAYYEIDHLNTQGVIGVWTHGFFDGWGPNYMLYAAIGHNAIGRFYETQGNGGADTRVITTPPADTSREWYRPNPPLPKVNWSARDNINMQESAILFGMSNVATNATEFLHDFYLKSKHSVEKATTEGPAAWVFPANDPRLGSQARLLDILQLQGVEIDRATAAFHAQGTHPGEAEAAGHDFPAGSYVVRMDQPYSREADMLLGQEYYNPTDPPPYDDTGWTMGALANVETVRVEDPAILKVEMTKVEGTIDAPGGAEGSGGVFAINANADPNLAAFRYKLASTPMQVAEKAFDTGGKHFNAGSIVIANADAGAIGAAAKDTGVQAVGIAAAPQVPMHSLEAPRIAVVHNWQSTQQDGWYRVSMDQLKIPYSYIADTYLRVTPDLRQKYDVIILPPLGGALANMINGLPMRGQPIPWENTPDMPDLVVPGLDSTHDMRGGLGLDGITNLEKFVNAGGLLVAVGPSMAVATDTGMVEGISARQPPASLNARGDVMHAEISDTNSPIAYGYGPTLDVYYSTGLLLSTGGGRGGRGGAPGGGRGGAPTRASGIGSPTIPDIIQTRPSDADLLKQSLGGAAPPAAGNAEDENPFAGRGAPAGPPPRTIVRFVPNAKDLLLSGLLSGGEAIAGQPLVVDARHGQGHILLFAGNPVWRNETSGEFALLFNAAMNYDHLDAGAPAPGAGRGGRGGRRGGQ